MGAPNPLDAFLTGAKVIGNSIGAVTKSIIQPPSTRDISTLPLSTTNQSIRGIVAAPQIGTYRRLPMTWRTPAYGYIQMYLNPQDVRISDQKIFTSTRTKAGFVMQYAGEDLTTIAINGTTGSSGIEGINILDAIYRSEQDAFNGVAEALDRRVSTAQLQSAANAALGQIGELGTLLSSITEEFAHNMFDSPYPTLASLAAAVEMYWQGQTFRGYFKSFSVVETAGTGLFEYQIEFIVFARQGTRRNFMPWHRQPYSPADSASNPLSYSDSTDQVTSPSFPSSTRAPASLRERLIRNNRDALADINVNITTGGGADRLSQKARQAIEASGEAQITSRLQRVSNFAAGLDGKSLHSDLDLSALLEE